jgi:hypothetical protein
MPTDWYERGCKRSCSEQHTYAWGDCDLAPESARPEPTVSMSYIYRDTDGYNSIGSDSYTTRELANLIEQAFRASDVAVSADHFPDLAEIAARAIIHRNDPQKCTRPDHACRTPGAGPCNGLPND